MMNHPEFPPVDGRNPHDPRQEYMTHQPPQVAHTPDGTRSKPQRGLWALGLIVLLVLAAIAALWIYGISNTLSSVQNGIHQNGSALTQQNSMLAGIRQQLSDVSAQLNRMDQTIHMFFIHLIQYLHQ